MRRIKRKEDEGAMGVGTLIVFIAMVLVAAVAASVLIETANKLQQQAQKTGDQAIREVSTAFVIYDVYGLDQDDDNQIKSIKFKLGLAAGAPPQNFDQTLIEIDDGSTSANLEVDDTDPSGAINAAEYHVTAVQDVDNTFSNSSGDQKIMEQGDKMLIHINVIEAGFSSDVGPQAEVNIKIIPKHGTPTLEAFFTPPVINNEVTHLG